MNQHKPTHFTEKVNLQAIKMVKLFAFKQHQIHIRLLECRLLVHSSMGFAVKYDFIHIKKDNSIRNLREY